MNRRNVTRLAALAAALLLASACSIDNQTMGVRGGPAGGAQFAVVANIGTSLSAGFESGGINDSTQREGPMYQLARAMGLTPGVDWNYPSLAGAGCPAPFTDPLYHNGRGIRVGGDTTGLKCAFRNTPAPAFINDVAIPALRAAQALDLTVVADKHDTLGLAQFITGSVNPVNAALRLHPTFVTIEVGANDALQAALAGDTTFLTSTAGFTASLNAIRDSLATLGAGLVGVAISNVPNVTVIPHFTKASTLWCLNNGACPGVPATLPYSSPGFSIAASCAPNAAGGVGDNYLLALPTTATITGALAAAGTARINCGAVDSTVANGVSLPAQYATINTAEYATITGRVTAFNTAIQTLATAQGWAYVDLNAALAAQAANIPAIPNLANSTQLFACPAAGCPTGTTTVFSLDGVHPTKAGYKVMASAFATAINAKYGTTLAVP